MSTLQTEITRLLGIQTPIVLAPMAGASGGALASQVSLAGGFGFLSPIPVFTGVEEFRDQFNVARSMLNIPSGPLPIGAGFLGWKLDEARSELIPLLELALENGVRAIWLSFGKDLSRWIEFVRNYHQDQKNSSKSPRTLVFVLVNSVDEALIAVQTWKVDVLVAQGIESGGHGSASAPPILNLIPQIISALPPSGAPPVLAAGGLSSGVHLAAFLTLGAAGAVAGTRFLVAKESQYSDEQKQAIIAAKSGSAVRSYVFDELRGSTGWPAGIDGRALSIPALAAIEGGADITRIKEEVAEGAKRGDPNSVIAWAGTGVGQVSRLEPAKDIVRELHEGAVAHLKALSILVGTA